MLADNVDSYDLKGVFTTEDNAQQFIERANQYHLSISEVILDPIHYTSLMHDSGRRYYNGKYQEP